MEIMPAASSSIGRPRKDFGTKIEKKELDYGVGDRVRVVKGGSWKDRAYWMQCGTRRYYDQDRSTSWIGFRCAMDRMGSRTAN